MAEEISIGKFNFIGITKRSDLLEGQYCPKEGCDEIQVEGLDLFGVGIAFRCEGCETLYARRYNYECSCSETKMDYYEIITDDTER